MLSVAEYRRENKAAALEWSRVAVELGPGKLEAQVWHGTCCIELGEYGQAERCFRAAIEIEPNRANLHHSLGISIRAQGRMGQATSEFEHAANLEPPNATFLTSLIESLIDENDMATALVRAQQLVELRPTDANSHMLLAQGLAANNSASEAEAEALLAAELAPRDGRTRAAVASILMATGKLDESRDECERAIELQPIQGLAYFNLVRCRRTTELDRSLIDQMLEVSTHPTLPLGQRALLEFGLGKAHEDLGAYEQSMLHYDTGNHLDHQVKFGSAEYDMELNRTNYEELKNRYSLEFLHKQASLGLDSEVPIFVFGMMRSGTTLLEQILSSHPAVGPAGEQRFWLKNRWVAFTNGRTEIDRTSLQDLGREYLELLGRIAPGRQFVVDKMPTNYLQAGLIHLAFPNARMIHMRRHPIDTCLSIYGTYNRVAIPWANDKNNIATNYERYSDLMSHWEMALPKTRILEVSYEDLVSNPRPEIERILEYCHLGWSDSCLQPELNERTVSTPSLCQVRQPIYQTSVARWRKFEPWLCELARLGERSNP